MIPTKNQPPQKPAAGQPSPSAPNTVTDRPKSGPAVPVWVWVIVAVLVIGGGAFFFINKAEKDRRREELEHMQQQLLEAAEEEEALYNASLEQAAGEAVEEEASVETPEEILDVQNVTEIDIVDDAAEAAGGGMSDFDRGTEDLNIVSGQAPDNTITPRPHPMEDNKVFTSVEQMAEFPGGEGAMFQYISDHIQYPPIAMENNIQGRVIVQFVVMKDGSIGDVKVARGKDPDLDKEAVRVVKTFPKFTPGKMNGQPVNVWYTLPINFKLP